MSTEVQDSLFKQTITAGWNVTSDGHVESPQGHFAVIEWPEHEGAFVELCDAVQLDFDEANSIMRGWYFVTENSDGIMTSYHMGVGKHGEFLAMRKYYQVQEMHNHWAKA